MTRKFLFILKQDKKKRNNFLFCFGVLKKFKNNKVRKREGIFQKKTVQEIGTRHRQKREGENDFDHYYEKLPLRIVFFWRSRSKVHMCR
jgi:hypothetical protein